MRLLSRFAALLAATLLAGGCAAPVDVVRTVPVGAATVAPDAPVVDARGPFRRTGRDEYRWRISPVTRERLGSSHRDGCPTRVEDLRLLQVSHWDLEGRLRSGELVVHVEVARPLVEVFRDLHEARFPVAKMRTVEAYAGSDDRSMADNNTSAYNCRLTTGGTRWSEHAYGTALDVNPVQNPYVHGSVVEPEAGRAYLDRSDVRPGMVVAGDEVVQAFTAIGWKWGGDWSSVKDYQHFSRSGR
jgi:hypothetical protein